MWLLIKYIRWNIWFCYNFRLKSPRHENGTWAWGAIGTRKETNKALKHREQTQGYQWIYQDGEVWDFNWRWRKTKSESVHLERLLDFRKRNSRSIWRWRCRSSWEWKTQWVRIETLPSLCCQIAFSHLLEDLVLSPGTAELESQGQSCGYGVKIFMINNPRGGGDWFWFMMSEGLNHHGEENVSGKYSSLCGSQETGKETNEKDSVKYDSQGHIPETHLFWGGPTSHLSPRLIMLPLYDSIKELVHSLGHCSHDLIVSGRSIRETQRGVLH